MNVIIVDTSIWIEFFKGAPFPDIELALKEGRVYLPVLVLAELLSAKLEKSNRRQLEDFLQELPLCDHSFNHWSKVGELRAHLLQKGIKISTPDAHVAQCALDLEGYLISSDKIFEKIRQETSVKILKITA